MVGPRGTATCEASPFDALGIGTIGVTRLPPRLSALPDLNHPPRTKPYEGVDERT